MKNSLLEYYKRAQKKTAIAVIVSGFFFFIVSLFFQYQEKQTVLNQQAQYIEKSIRNDMLTGNKLYVYEICRSLFSDSSLESLKILKNAEVYCDFKREAVSHFFLSVSVPILFNPLEAAVNENILGSVELKLNAEVILINLLISVICLAFIIIAFYFALRKLHTSIKEDIVVPLDRFSYIMTTNPRDETSVEALKDDTKFSEMLSLTSSYIALIGRLKVVENKLTEESKRAALADLSRQVSHDIRSPLSALNMVMSQLPQLSEEKRVLIRNSVQRINDIANSLLEKGTTSREINDSNTDKKLEVILLGSLIDSIVSEKRIQFRDRINIEIVTDIGDAFGVFARANANELKRILSNLINNSVEAFGNGGGKVTVSLRGQKETTSITVSDTGKGIPKNILSKLLAGEKGVSHGKEGTDSGSGIGIFHAKSTIESFGGRFDINTKEGTGTMISMILPREKAPKWFAEKIEISEGQMVIAVDDDQSIHNIWQGCFNCFDLQKSKVQLLNFSSSEVFEKWFNDNSHLALNGLFLMDYELLGQELTGLSLIEKYKIGAKSILVTSRYDEKDIYERCEHLGARVLPKSMAGFVPLIFTKSLLKPDVILIDDDELIHMSWEMVAKENQKSYVGFRNYNDFLKEAEKIDPSAMIFIDSNLGTEKPGELIAKEIFEMGFHNVFLSTGYNADSFQNMPWIKGVVGKSFPADE
ncbi:MAG: sensor histidine kinase [Bdellovibrio sp.]